VIGGHDVTRLGIVSDELHSNFAAALRDAQLLGLHDLELRQLSGGRVPCVDEAEVRAVEAAVAAGACTIGAISPGLYKYARTPQEARRERERLYPAAATLTKRLHVPALIIFGPAKPRATDLDGPLHSSADPPRWVDEAIGLVSELAARDGIRVLLEPEPISYTDTVAATAAVLQRLDCRQLGLNYDPGNLAWAEGRDPRDGIARLGRWIENVHVKDAPAFLPGRLPAWGVPGEGLIDYVHQFAELRRIDYRGPITLEPHVNGDIALIATCAEAVRALLAKREVV